MSLPSNPIVEHGQSFFPYRYPHCKHPEPGHQQFVDTDDGWRGLKRETHRQLHSSKLPRSMSSMRNAVFAIATNEKVHSDVIEERHFMWKPRNCATRAEYDRFLAWHPPTPRNPEAP